MPEGEKVHFRLFAHLQLVTHDYGRVKIAMKDRHVVDKPIIIKSLLELDCTLYTVIFQNACPAAEELIILTHTLLSLQG